MTRVLSTESRFSKTITCPVCHKRKIVHRRNGKYCSGRCRTRACLHRKGKWKGSRVELPGLPKPA